MLKTIVYTLFIRFIFKWLFNIDNIFVVNVLPHCFFYLKFFTMDCFCRLVWSHRTSWFCRFFWLFSFKSTITLNFCFSLLFPLLARRPFHAWMFFWFIYLVSFDADSNIPNTIVVHLRVDGCVPRPIILVLILTFFTFLFIRVFHSLPHSCLLLFLGLSLFFLEASVFLVEIGVLPLVVVRY